MSATPDAKRIGGTTFLSFTIFAVLGEDLALLEPVAGLGLESPRIARPLHERLVGRELALAGLAGRSFVDLLRLRDQRRGEAEPEQR